MKVLAINPGSTSTKIAIFEGEVCIWKEVIGHPTAELVGFAKIADQHRYRMEVILKELQNNGFELNQFSAIVGRGGIIKPLSGGTYLVDEDVVHELFYAPASEHASNLGGIIAFELAKQVGIPAYFVDPVSVDEMEAVARLSGHPELPRYSQSHALNMKAVARKVAKSMGKRYDEVNLVVAHLGSGISVAPHRQGKMIDVNNANNEGPFSPERCGTVPASYLVKLCYSGKYTEGEMLDQLVREGGLYAYLGTKDLRKAEMRMAEGDEHARLVLEALCYQVAKEIGAMATVLAGVVDRIVLTGGLAHSEFVVDQITKRVAFIAPLVAVPGEEEMESLALGALRVLNGEEDAKRYRDGILAF